MKQVLTSIANSQRILLAIIIFSCYGCQNFLYKSNNEGSIEYKITYPPEATQDNFLAPFMPTKMLMNFKNDITVSEIKIGIGLMSVSYIADPKAKKLITLLQVANKKYALILDSTQVNEQLNKSPELKIIFSNETKTIAGFKCNKATVTDSDNVSYDVYYTKDIKVKNPNWDLPLKKIDGVMLEYQIKQNNILMKLTATNVNGREVDDKIFDIPSDYKIVSKAEMPEVFSRFFQ